MFTIEQDFSWAHNHVDVKTYTKGDTLETDDQDLIDVATVEGWIRPAEEKATKARKAAPENKAD
jgi:hypothetical protein